MDVYGLREWKYKSFSIRYTPSGRQLYFSFLAFVEKLSGLLDNWAKVVHINKSNDCRSKATIFGNTQYFRRHFNLFHLDFQKQIIDRVCHTQIAQIIEKTSGAANMCLQFHYFLAKT